MLLYQFIDMMRQQYPLKCLCETLDVSRSCFYDWERGRTHIIDQTHQNVEDQIIAVFRQNKRRYGSRRIVAELSHMGVTAGPYRVRKVLSAKGLKAIQPRSFVPRTTDSRHPYPISPNLLAARPFLTSINEVWVGDITYIPMSDGSFRYLSVWMDLYSRKVIGWDLQDHMKEPLVIASLEKALAVRKVTDKRIIHSDRGGQYAGTEFRRIIDKHKLFQGMCDTGDPYGNPHMESHFSRFKAELLEGGAFDSAEDSQTEIFEFIEMYYNTTRLHSSLGYLSPNNFEQKLNSKP